MFLALFTTRICSLSLPLWQVAQTNQNLEIFAKRVYGYGSAPLLGHVGMWRQQPNQIVVICYRRSYKHGSYANYDCGMAPACQYQYQYQSDPVMVVCQQTGCKQASAKCSTSHGRARRAMGATTDWRCAIWLNDLLTSFLDH